MGSLGGGEQGGGEHAGGAEEEAAAQQEEPQGAKTSNINLLALTMDSPSPHL